MPSVFKLGKKWCCEYTGADGKRHRKAGFRDRASTVQLAARLEAEAARARAGLPPRREPRPAAARSVVDLIDEYAADLAARGRTALYVRKTRSLLAAAVAATGWSAAADLATATPAAWVAKAASPRSYNERRDTLHWFGGWLARSGHAAANPFAGLPAAPRNQRVKERRALTRDEFRRLLAAVPDSRKAAYELAAYTGFRHKELRLLEWRDADFGTDPAVWRLRASATKARRGDVVPMTREAEKLALKLRLAAGSPADTARVVRVPCRRTVRQDFAAAGVGPGSDGKAVNFHSLRYFFCQELAKVLPVQVVKELMRHKSITTTVDLYARLGLADLADRVRELPPIFGEG